MIWIHIIWTVLLFTVFVVIVTWAWSGRQKTRFREAANIPLQDDLTETKHHTD